MYLPSRSRIGLIAALSIGAAATFAPSAVAHAQDSTKKLVNCKDGVVASTAAICTAGHGGLASSSAAEVNSFQFGVQSPVSTTNGASGERKHDPVTVTTEVDAASPLTKAVDNASPLTKEADAASPTLLQPAVTNETFNQAPARTTHATPKTCWNGQIPTTKNPCPPRPTK
jgi:hypothetical protein